MSDLELRIRKAVKEIEDHEAEYKDVYFGKKKPPNPNQPRSYWEGLVSGYISAQITLWKHVPELLDK